MYVSQRARFLVHASPLNSSYQSSAVLLLVPPFLRPSTSFFTHNHTNRAWSVLSLFPTCRACRCSGHLRVLLLVRWMREGGERKGKKPKSRRQEKARRLCEFQSVLLAIDNGRSTTHMNRKYKKAFYCGRVGLLCRSAYCCCACFLLFRFIAFLAILCIVHHWLPLVCIAYFGFWFSSSCYHSHSLFSFTSLLSFFSLISHCLPFPRHQHPLSSTHCAGNSPKSFGITSSWMLPHLACCHTRRRRT